MQKTRPWAILAAGAAIQILTGLPAAWGVFQQPVMEEYGLSEQGAGLCVRHPDRGIRGGVCDRRLSARPERPAPRGALGHGPALRRVLCGGPPARGSAGGWFWVLFSVPAGLGTAFLYPSIQSCAQKWYEGRKGLATGVIGGAVGLSAARSSPSSSGRQLRGFGPVQGIRGAFWALGALTLPVCLVGSAAAAPTRRRTSPGPASRAGERQNHRSWTSAPAADAAHQAVLALRRGGVLFHPGGAAVQPHHLKAGHGAGAGRADPRCGAWCWAAWAVRPGRLLMPHAQ